MATVSTANFVNNCITDLSCNIVGDPNFVQHISSGEILEGQEYYIDLKNPSATFKTPYPIKAPMSSSLGENELDVTDIKTNLETDIIGKSIYGFYTVDSTNDVARKYANKGAQDGAVIIAETQNAGKGRLKRTWISLEGGLWLSVILRPKIPPQKATLVTLMTANAVVETLSQYNIDAKIKWPNDVLVKGKKVCGILTEAKTKEKMIEYLILGIGINANFELSDLPEDIRGSSTTIRHVLKKDVPLDELLHRLLVHMDMYYKMLQASDFDKIVRNWKEKSDTLGRYVKIETQMESIKGIAEDIDETGALILKTDNGDFLKIFAGDCVYLRSME
jgi:BirA family biotin operon repressor/biotin-[acetyl-CoA-carboxylase] ligase